MADRWKRAVAATNGAMGDAVGRLYVARYFPPEAKAKAQAMVADLKAAFAARIRHARLDVAADEGQGAGEARHAHRRRRLSGQVARLRRARDHARRGAAATPMRAEVYRVPRRPSPSCGKPIDRAEWWMTPQTVNAVNLPIQNALNFPAAILQPPYFDPTRSRRRTTTAPSAR